MQLRRAEAGPYLRALMAVVSLFGVLGAFVLWVMIWRESVRRLAAKAWYVRHLSGFVGGALAWFVVVTVVIALNGNLGAKARQAGDADTAGHTKVAHATATPPAVALPAALARVAAPVQPPTAAPEAPPPPAPAPPPISEPVRAALAPAAGPFKAWFEKLGLVFQSSPLADGTPRLLGRTPDNMTSLEIIGHDQAIEKAALMFALASDNTAVTARNTGAVMVFMRETGWDKGWRWAVDSINKKTVKTRHGAVDYEMKTIDGLPLCVLTASPAH